MSHAAERSSARNARIGPNACEGAIARRKPKATATESISAAGWSCEGTGIEGSKDSTLLFELGSNDHEFGFVIMEKFYQMAWYVSRGLVILHIWWV